MRSAPAQRKRPVLRSYEIKLGRVFRRVVALSLGVPAALQGCSTSDNAGSPVDGGTDATLQPDGGKADGMADALVEMGITDSPIDSSLDTLDTGLDAGTDAADDVTDAASEGTMWCSDAAVGAPYFNTDAAKPCIYLVDFSCAEYPVRNPGTCYLNVTDCFKVCTLDAGIFGCSYSLKDCTLAGVWLAEAGQPVTVGCELCVGAGRRPTGLRRASSRAATPLGRYFARASFLEAASVHAFRRLGSELQAHGAPAHLVRASERSARDEIRHARLTAVLARRHGAEPPRARVRAQRVRALEHVARENAVEGCVRETFGALLATWQAAHAEDKGVRRVMARIAVDETRHAALAWAVAGWADSQLDARARMRVARARRVAVGALARELSGGLPPSSSQEAHEAGLPSASEARTLMAALSEMWMA